MSKCISSTDGTIRDKHYWIMFGSGFTTEYITCDICCPECGRIRTVVITNDTEGNKVFDKIVDNDMKFKIPKSVYVRQYNPLLE